MSAEILGGWLIKLAWSPFLAWFWYITKREDKRREEKDKAVDERLEKTYDKTAIDAMLEHNKLMIDQRQTFTEQRIANIETMFTSYMNKSEDRDERINNNLSDINTNIAVLTTRINKRKDDNNY